jgi:hypothetical protein
VKIELERVSINRQGYDSHGRYWGTGAPLYAVHVPDTRIYEHVRASSAKDARAKLATDKDFQRKIKDEEEIARHGMTTREAEARLRNRYPLGF